MKKPLSKELIITIQQLAGIGNKTIMKLVDSMENSLYTLEDLINYWPLIKGKKFEAINSDDIKEAYRKAEHLMDKAEKNDVGIFSYFDDIYPDILRSCVSEEGKSDPPLILYYRGDIEALKQQGIAVIGTREPTQNGEMAGIHFAGEFAKRGFNIVSGLAIGCDSMGHRGALAVGGTTTAFLANGLDWDSIYPKDNLELAKRIVDNGGLLLSEYAIGQSCGRYGLVARDRLQAGLSLATVVVQTGIKGGTMHAVNATIASHKPLFAVEYKNAIDLKDDKTQGNLKLIKEGKAHPLRSGEIEKAIDIINGFWKKKTTPTQLNLF